MESNILLQADQEIDLFYNKVSSLMGDQLPGKTFGRGRWRRGGGRGRFKDIGIIRYYSPSHIHVIFHTPPHNKIYNSEQSVLNAIKDLFS